MRHFSVDTRTINKAQSKALKAAAKAAGMDVTYWRWRDRKVFPIMTTQASDSTPGMCLDDEITSSNEAVTYAEAMRRLSADAAEPAQPSAPMTPAQEAGFEVGDLAVVVKEGSNFGHGSIARLEVDDGSGLPRWGLIDGDCAFSWGFTYANPSRFRKLTNVKEAQQ